MSDLHDIQDVEVERLAQHQAFTIANPNRLRALVGSFTANQWVFHAADGRGYRFLTDMILAADKLNPQTAARFVPPLGRWRRFDEKRQAPMREQLERIVATPGLSKDVFEQASKSLGWGSSRPTARLASRCYWRRRSAPGRP